MSKKTRIWLCIAAAFVILGLGLFTVAIAANGWDFTKLDTALYETNTYEISEEFYDLSVHTDTADLFFVPSKDGKCKVVCYEEVKVKHSVAVQDGTLTIQVRNEKEWYDFIGIDLGTPKITVYLPDAEYGSLLVKESTGDVEISNDFRFENVEITTSTGHIQLDGVFAKMFDFSVSTGSIIAADIRCEGDIKIHVSTGRAELSDMVCRNVISDGNTGNISMKRVFAEETFHIERSTGDVTFDSCDAAEIFVRTNTGDVTGTLLTGKIFYVQTSTGRIDVPKSVTGGMCQIATTTGDVHLTIG